MGKKIIIKGADFSAHPVNTSSWVLDYREVERDINKMSIVSLSPFVPIDYANLQGKTITKIRMKIKQAGEISIVKGTTLGSPFTKIIEFNTSSSDVDTIKEFSVQISVGDNDIIGVQNPSDTGLFGFYDGGSADEGVLADFYVNASSSNYSIGNHGQRLCVSFYCES